MLLGFEASLLDLGVTNRVEAGGLFTAALLFRSAPVFFGAGIRLFEGIDRRKVALEIVEAIHSPLVTHLRYAVTKP